VKVAVEAICRRDANLITADVAIQFMMKKLRQSDLELAKRMYDELKVRILERRTVWSDVASYLYYGNDNELDGHSAGYFVKSSKTAITSSLKILHDIVTDTQSVSSDVIALEIDDESTQMSEAVLPDISLESELDLAINKARNYKIDETQNDGPSRVFRDSRAAAVAAIKKEMSIMESLGSRGKMLKPLLEMLMTVPPCTVESERAFSSANNFCRKIRTNLGDESLNALVFLKYYFNKLK